MDKTSSGSSKEAAPAERYKQFRESCIRFTKYHKHLKEEIVVLFGPQVLDRFLTV